MTVAGLVLGALAALAPAAAPAEEGPSRAAIESVVRDLLEREPELVIDAIRTYQAEQEAERSARATAAIETHRAALVSTDHPSVGPADAAVTLIEFFDYRCGYCRQMVPRLAALREDSDDLRIVFVEFPVLGPDSLRAAQASLAVWRQRPEAYEAVHEALMAAEDLSAPALVAIAEAHGLDGERLLEDMQGVAIQERLMENHRIAQDIGIEGTPAFIVGDRLLPGAVPLEQLRTAVAAAGG